MESLQGVGRLRVPGSVAVGQWTVWRRGGSRLGVPCTDQTTAEREGTAELTDDGEPTGWMITIEEVVSPRRLWNCPLCRTDNYVRASRCGGCERSE